MLRSIAELVAYGMLAMLLAAASLAPETTSSATTDHDPTRAAALSAIAATGATSETRRGALLFATKGCTGCHRQASFPQARMQVGPDLTALADRAATRVAGLDARGYVWQSLRDPGAYRVAGYTAAMPDLALSDEQIDALATFLLSSAR